MIRGYQKHHFVALLLLGIQSLLVNTAGAADPKDAGHFDDEPSLARLPGVWLPTGVSLFTATPIGTDLSIELSTSAKYTAEVYSENGGVRPNQLVYLTPRLGVQFGALDAGLQLNLMNTIMRSIDNDFKKNGQTISNGLVAKPTPAFLEKVWVNFEIFSISGDESANEDQWLAVSLQVGRQAASPLGIAVLPYRATMSIVDSQKIDQVDLVALNFNILRNTAVQFVLFGVDALGYPVDQTYNPYYKNLKQGYDPSVAVNLIKKLEPIEIYFSYARIRDGFVNINQIHQRGAQDKFSTGLKYTAEGFTVSVEGGYAHNISKNIPDEGFVSAQIAYEIPNTSITPFAVFERLQSAFKDEIGSLLSLGIRWRILENIDFTIEGFGILRDHSDDDFGVMTGINISPKSAEFDFRSVSEVEHE